MLDKLMRWEGILESWSFRAGIFYTSVDVKSDLIEAGSAVTASASETDDAGMRFLGDAVIIVGAVVPYDGGAHVQIGIATNSLDPAKVRLAITLAIAHPA